MIIPPSYPPQFAEPIRLGRRDHASRSTSWVDGAKNTLCYAQPPVIRSRLAQSAYWIIYRARLELCRPRPPISASLSKLPPLSPPSLEPGVTRTKGGDTLATRTWPAITDQPADPEPAHAGIRWQSRRHSHVSDLARPQPRSFVKTHLVQRRSRIARWLAALTVAAAAAHVPALLLVGLLAFTLSSRIYKLLPALKRWLAPNQQLTRTRELLVYYCYTLFIKAYHSSRRVYVRERAWRQVCNHGNVASVEWAVWFYATSLLQRIKGKHTFVPEWVPEDSRNGTDMFESENEFLQGTTPAYWMDEWDESMREASSSRSPSPAISEIADFDPHRGSSRTRARIPLLWTTGIATAIDVVERTTFWTDIGGKHSARALRQVLRVEQRSDGRFGDVIGAVDANGGGSGTILVDARIQQPIAFLPYIYHLTTTEAAQVMSKRPSQGEISEFLEQNSNKRLRTDDTDSGAEALQVPSVLTPAPIWTRDPDYYYEDGSAVLLVDGVLFKVHASLIKAQSEVFRDMFALPPCNSNIEPEGATDERPIDIPGVLARDFRKLLGVIYCPLSDKLFLHLEARNKSRSGALYNFDFYSAVARLANRFCMMDVETWAANHLRSLVHNSASHISAGARGYTLEGDPLAFILALHYTRVIADNSLEHNIRNMIQHYCIAPSKLSAPALLKILRYRQLRQEDASMFGFLFITLLNFGHQVWEQEPFTREERIALFSAQVHLTPLPESLAKDLTMPLLTNHIYRREGYLGALVDKTCSVKCHRRLSTAWKDTFDWNYYTGVLGSHGVKPTTQLGLLPCLRLKFASVTRTYSSCEGDCSAKVLGWLDTDIFELFTRLAGYYRGID
ncbi:hypothetical protein FRC07_013353 [Ceratobasidium sp. 392]|nr:hypothetical protein FRC07_013353 [Ceratobasidium sp. 392]